MENKLDKLMTLAEGTAATSAGIDTNREMANSMDLAAEMLKAGKFLAAREQLLILQGKSEVVSDPRFISRVHNNLGVSMNLPSSLGGNLSKALEHFREAMRHDSQSAIVRANLAQALLNRKNAGDCDDALRLTDFATSDPDKIRLLFASRLRAIAECSSDKDVLDYINSEPEAWRNVKQSPQATALVSSILHAGNEDEKALALIDEAISLTGRHSELLAVKARILIQEASMAERQYASRVIALRYDDATHVREALALLREAKSAAQPFTNPSLLARINTDLLLCLSRLDLLDSDSYKACRSEICEDSLACEERDQLYRLDFIVHLKRREYSEALDALVQQSTWEASPYAEKVYAARMLMFAGAIREAEQLLAAIEASSSDQLDVQYWGLRASTMSLLSNKTAVFDSAARMVKAAIGTADEKDARHDLAAFVQRYVRDGEVDRLLDEMLTYHKLYPEDNLVRKLPAIDSDGNLTPEARLVLSRQREWYENTRTTYTETGVPSYYLEEAFGCTYAEFLTMRRDLSFTIAISLANDSYEKNLADALENAQSIVLDYASLLNLAGMGMLALLPSLGKTIHVAFGVFEKSRRELLRIEHREIRIVWNTLREDPSFHIAHVAELSTIDERMERVFDPWLVDSIALTKQTSAVFICDDLHLARFVTQNENLPAANSLTILRALYSAGTIDKRSYSQSIGIMADRFYIPLTFDADDLVNIAAVAGGKITPGAFHLIKQIQTPGFNPVSIAQLYAAFVPKLWALGFASSDKAIWIRVLTDLLLDALDAKEGSLDSQQLINIKKSLALMWYQAMAVKHSMDEESLSGLLDYLRSDKRTDGLAKLLEGYFSFLDRDD